MRPRDVVETDERAGASPRTFPEFAEPREPFFARARFVCVQESRESEQRVIVSHGVDRRQILAARPDLVISDKTVVLVDDDELFGGELHSRQFAMEIGPHRLVEQRPLLPNSRSRRTRALADLLRVRADRAGPANKPLKARDHRYAPSPAICCE